MSAKEGWGDSEAPPRPLPKDGARGGLQSEMLSGNNGVFDRWFKNQHSTYLIEYHLFPGPSSIELFF
jgi:hypothetical protein